MNTQFDAIIIGSGAGGAAAAFRLAEAGRKVLLLEKGPELPADGSTQDARAVLRERRFSNREAWADRHDKPFVPSEFYNLGGKTKWYGAALPRFGRDEFAADPAYQYRGWPFPYEELEPYYDEAEALLGVRQFQIEPDTSRIVAALKRSSRHWCAAPLPLGLSPSVLNDPKEATRFDGFASQHGLKSDAETRLISRIRNKPNVAVVTGAPVASLLGDDLAPHKITGVITEDGAVYRARAVILAAGALSSPRLLQQYFEKQVLPARCRLRPRLAATIKAICSQPSSPGHPHASETSSEKPSCSPTRLSRIQALNLSALQTARSSRPNFLPIRRAGWRI